ncbi:MAG: DUF2721 domain-containing protein [Proteobacteria bacterium]|nr:DUF2721 domain-containing protein [Pseudomonadota bacterium]
MSVFLSQSVDIAHLIQVALTPIFLISGVGVMLNVMTSRLARIVDRARQVEDRIRRGESPEAVQALHDALRAMARRARHMNHAITLITISALLISLVVVSLFLNAFLMLELGRFIAIMFIGTMLTLAIGLLEFLIEVRIATDSLRIGIMSETRDS